MNASNRSDKIMLHLFRRESHGFEAGASVGAPPWFLEILLWVDVVGYLELRNLK